MRYFQKLLLQLHETCEHSKPGQEITPPELLQKVEINQKRLCYTSMGINNPGTPIICVHGFGGFFLDWGQILLPLSRQHQVYALDLPGWGFSEITDRVDGLEVHIDTLNQFMEKLSIKSAILVGISYGAAICWGVSVSKQIPIERMILLNPMPPFPLQYMTSPLYRLIFQFNKNWTLAKYAHKLLSLPQYKMTCMENVFHKDNVDPLYIRLGHLLIKQPKVAKSIHQFAHHASEIDWKSWESKVKTANIPTNIIKGENDKVFNRQSAEYLNTLISQSHLEFVPECGHAMVFDKPRYIATRIKKILSDPI